VISCSEHDSVVYPGILGPELSLTLHWSKEWVGFPLYRYQE